MQSVMLRLTVLQVTINGLARVLCMREYLDQSAVTPQQTDNRKQKMTSNEMTSFFSSSSSSSSNFRFPPQPNGGVFHVTVHQRLCPTAPSSSLFSSPSLIQSPQSSSAASLLSTCGGDGAGDGGEGPLPVPETMETDVREIRVMLRSYLARLGDKDVQAKVTREWRVVARVFDRLFFFVYCSTVVLSLATIFPRGAE